MTYPGSGVDTQLVIGAMFPTNRRRLRILQQDIQLVSPLGVFTYITSASVDASCVSRTSGAT